MGEDYSFSHFAAVAVYQQVNAEQVSVVPNLANSTSIVDVGAGTGIITKLAAERAPKANIIAIEPDLRQIEKAILHIGSCAKRVDFVQARAEDLLPGMPDCFADVVFFCNAIHLLSDEEKQVAIQSAHKILRPGGYLVMNTAFAAESVPRHTRRYYLAWMKIAREILNQKKVEEGLQVEEAGERNQARKPLSRDRYIDLLSSENFILVEDKLTEVEITYQGWEAISKYWLFLEGALPGVPYPIASQILLRALDKAFVKGWPTDWTRVWLQFVAQKV